jgi:hypothetical protein
MKNITTNITRLALLCLAVAGLGQSAQAQQIEALVPGYAGYVLIVPGLKTATGAVQTTVVWDPDSSRHISGAVKRGEKLRISGGQMLLSLATSGVNPLLSVKFNPPIDEWSGDYLGDPSASYVNTTRSATTDILKKQLTLSGKKVEPVRRGGDIGTKEEDPGPGYLVYNAWEKKAVKYLISVPLVSSR